MTSCARIPVQEIQDARDLFEAAKSSCARVYMTQEMKQAQSRLGQIDRGTRKKTRLPKKKLRKLALEVQDLSKKMVNETARIKTRLYKKIQQNILLAIKNIHEGEKAEANRYARKEYREAIAGVRKARKLSQEECRYTEALKESESALEYAKESITKARAFKKELEKKLPHYHIVRKGETLKSIAKSEPVYGDESFWEIIYKANRDQIRNPDVLYPGQQIYLPSRKEFSRSH
ncbi:MAG: LysM peptidoglycan-binding domain-containing protein [Deltaproteobacteria bacterium]|nr:LysM peptidoglycan-binding domain-containing protein [Deltaproteobacteria bacterium]